MYFEYYPLAQRIATYVLKEPMMAEDIAQNVFLKLWKTRDQLKSIKNLKSYIVQMSRNAALNQLEKYGKEKAEVSLELVFEDEAADNDDSLKNAIQKAVSDLPTQCRLVFSLSRFEGLTNPEIADYLSISTRTVETQISKALKLFRTELRHYFIDFLGFGILLMELGKLF